MVALHNHPLFEGVSAESLALLSEDMVRYFRSDDFILRENDPASHLIVILDGEVQVFTLGTFLSSRRAGEIVGEQAIIDSTPRSATVIARGMVKVAIVPPHVVDRLMKDLVFLLNLTKAVSAKLREATTIRSVRFRNEERLFSEFSAHVSAEVASQLLSRGASYGKPRFQDVAILQADIRSFTDKCGRMSPEQIGEQLSEYLGTMVAILFKHGAFVDKFIGDAILAVWGITSCPDSLAVAALDCAIEMTETAATLHFGGEPMQIGVGLNVGNVFVGNIGSDQKRQFTVLGSPVNLAARLEVESKALRAPIALGNGFYELLPLARRTDLQEHKERQIKGFRPQTVYSWSPREVGAASSSLT